ncbi:hypothetical protein [Bacillus sp. 2205SS5-2]|uniref:hypothetical protein n=1 Tax=Bacillus sp. 2205SS5-2 TaxID=3109031 RepID=UPI003007E422
MKWIHFLRWSTKKPRPFSREALLAYFMTLAYKNGWKHTFLSSFRVKNNAKRCPKHSNILNDKLIRKATKFAKTALNNHPSFELIEEFRLSESYEKYQCERFLIYQLAFKR